MKNPAHILFYRLPNTYVKADICNEFVIFPAQMIRYSRQN